MQCPRAAEMPTRRPVKLPWPTVTAMRLMGRGIRLPASLMTRAIIASRLRPCPRTSGCVSLAMDHSQLGIEHRGGASCERSIDGQDEHMCQISEISSQ